MCAKRCGLQRSGSGNGHGARGRGDGGKRGTTRTWQQRQQADHNGDQATTQQRWGATARRGPGIDEAGGHDAGHDVAMVVVAAAAAAGEAGAVQVQTEVEVQAVVAQAVLLVVAQAALLGAVVALPHAEARLVEAHLFP